MKNRLPVLLLGFLSTISQPLSTSAQGTAFTYQGQLATDGNAAQGIYDLRFAIYGLAGGGGAVAGPVTNVATGVTNGLFAVTLDFGAGVFDGSARWLEIAVRTNGGTAFTALAPRQALTAAPYAVHAGSAATAAAAGGVPASGIGAGTANISITGNALTATTAAYAGLAASSSIATTALTAGTATNLVGNVTDAQLPANVARLNGTNSFTGTNRFAGAVIATNANNVFAGTFAGNGGALTNLNTAQFANSVLTNGTTGVTLGGTFNGQVNGDGAGVTNVNAAQLNGLGAANFWQLGGNSVSGAQFLGSTNDQALELRVNGLRALRLEPNWNGSPNVIGGSPANVVDAGVVGAFMGSGGSTNYWGIAYSNRISADFGVIVGGSRNEVLKDGNLSFIGAGYGNTIGTNSTQSAIVGGVNNAIKPLTAQSFIGGGSANSIQTNSYLSVISGGSQNTILPYAWNAFIGGGHGNTNGGLFSTVPGGLYNATRGQGSFAAGQRAKALHTGAFVWADSTGVDFTSSAEDQFLIRANGNVGINKTNPATTLDVNGTVTAVNFAGNGAGLTNLNAVRSVATGSGLTGGPITTTGTISIQTGGVVNTMLANPSLTVNTTSPLSGGGTVALGGSLTLALTGTVPLAQLPSAVVTNNTTTAVNLTGTFTGNGANVTNVNAAAVGGLGVTNLWHLDGNNVIAGQFLGSTNNQALEFKVNGLRALRLEPAITSVNYSNEVNVVGGSPYNTIAAGAIGSVIAGGGGYYYGIHYTNSIAAVFSFIGGGFSNSVQAGAGNAFLGGGYGNTVKSNAYESVLGGGRRNVLESGAAFSVLGGGNDNSIQTDAYYSVLGGGAFNSIEPNAIISFLGGGYENSIQTNAQKSVLVGGFINSIQTNADYAFLGGGQGNVIKTNADNAFLGGGLSNVVSGVGAVVAGGGCDGSSTNGNTASGGGSVVVGGTQNIASGSRGTVGGGHNNSATNFYATVPGGAWNMAGGSGSFAAGQAAKAYHNNAFVWNDNTSGDLVSTNANSVSMRASGGYRLYSGASAGVSLAANGTSWAVMSDRNAKKNFAAVDGENVLNKLAGIPIQQWNYKWEADGATPNLGPMAQDFKAAFYPGRDDKSITTLEYDGVELAAIQGLNEKLEVKTRKLEADNAELRSANRSLEQRLEKLERLLSPQTR